MPSPSINLIKSSDGTGNAAMATVQSTRAPLASTIIVDTVDNIPATFYGSMGTPHTFVDPITAETITVISEATSRDFEGHVDGTNLEIDAMAPGNTDLGSAAGDVIIIKPTTEWANNVAEVLAQSHDDVGNITTNTIAEHTAAAGVTIDSLNIKDGFVTGGAGTGVKNASLDTTAGELGGAWITWTPTWTNFTLGNGTLVARYQKIGKTVRGVISIIYGSTSSITGSYPAYTLPVTAATTTQFAGIAMNAYLDNGTAWYYGQFAVASAGTTSTLTVTNTAGSYAAEAGISSTIPMTWANGDKIISYFEYEAA